MLTVANPIYDIVFKFLMEDERIAKTLLSALLKKNVVKVEVRKHEYTNGSRDNISMFRIDFAATIEEEDGMHHLILIELQKTWLETETLRFRQYLAAHYSNQENILKENNPKRYAIPMVAVYILGHRIGNIDVPVIYCNKVITDYDGKVLTEGIPDPFMESLSHDTIFVQIPLLRGRFNNRLEKVLSVFDQSRKSRDNRHVLNLDDDLFKDDEEMMHIVHRLLAAASDAELRQTMNVEDEYFSAIEERDTAIMHRDEIIADQDRQIADQDRQIADQGRQIADQGRQLADQGRQLAEKDKIMMSMIKTMAQSGMTIEAIAQTSGMTVDEIQRIIER